MKNLLKDKKVLIGLVIAGALAYYFYDKNKKNKIKADAEAMASTPATTTPETATTTTTTTTTMPKHNAGYKPLDTTSTANQPTRVDL
jgi:uncharacterized membrane protein YebE (DUF533 family)